jgi:hypothetical protein
LTVGKVYGEVAGLCLSTHFELAGACPDTLNLQVHALTIPWSHSRDPQCSGIELRSTCILHPTRVWVNVRGHLCECVGGAGTHRSAPSLASWLLGESRARERYAQICAVTCKLRCATISFTCGWCWRRPLVLGDDINVVTGFTVRSVLVQAVAFICSLKSCWGLGLGLGFVLMLVHSHGCGHL